MVDHIPFLEAYLNSITGVDSFVMQQFVELPDCRKQDFLFDVLFGGSVHVKKRASGETLCLVLAHCAIVVQPKIQIAPLLLAEFLSENFARLVDDLASRIFSGIRVHIEHDGELTGLVEF